MAGVEVSQGDILRNYIRRLKTIKHPKLREITTRTAKACEAMSLRPEHDFPVDLLNLRRGILDIASWIVVYEDCLDLIPEKWREKVISKARKSGQLSKVLERATNLVEIDSTPGDYGSEKMRKKCGEINDIITKRLKQFDKWFIKSEYKGKPIAAEFLPGNPSEEPHSVRPRDLEMQSHGGEGCQDETSIKRPVERQNTLNPQSSTLSGQLDPNEVISSGVNGDLAQTTEGEPNDPNPDQAPHQEDLRPTEASNVGGHTDSLNSQPLQAPVSGHLEPGKEKPRSGRPIPQPMGNENESFGSGLDLEFADEESSELELDPASAEGFDSNFFASQSLPSWVTRGTRKTWGNEVDSTDGSGSQDWDIVDYDEGETDKHYDFLIYHAAKDVKGANKLKNMMNTDLRNRVGRRNSVATFDDFHAEGLKTERLQKVVQCCTLVAFYITENTRYRAENLVDELSTIMLCSKTHQGCIKKAFLIGHGSIDLIREHLSNDNLFLNLMASDDGGPLCFDCDAPDFLQKMCKWFSKYHHHTTQRENNTGTAPLSAGEFYQTNQFVHLNHPNEQ